VGNTLPYPGNLLGNYSSIKKGENRLGAHITLVSTQNDVQSAINFAPAILMGLISGSSLVISTENAAISLKKYTENNYKDEQCHIYYTSGKPETYLTGIRKKFPALKNQLFARQIAAIPLKGQRVVYDALRLNGTAKINGPETAKNDTEKKLIDILENLLNKKEIGLTDNFFELGGNSLKAIQVISRVYKELNAVIEFKDIFKNPKIADLASVISNTYTHLYQSIEPVEPQPFYDLSHPQKRLWGLNEQEEDHIAYNMPMGYFLNGKVNVQLLEKSFKTLINRHEILRTVFITVKGEPKQKVNPGTNGFNLKYLDIRSEVDKDNLIGDVARDEFTCSFDLETGPLLRATVIHIEEEKYLLLFTMHHIISDGWSLQIIFNELIATYNACLSGGQPALADLKIHYKDYSAWYGKLLLSDDILVHKNYWAQKLGSKNFEAVIPADNNIVAGRNYDGNTRTFSLGREVVEKLGLFIGKHEVTTFILTQAIIKVLLSKYSGQKDVTIGAPMAGRGHKELEGQIGFYLNNLVLLDEVENDDSFLVFLSKVKQTSLEAYIHQVYPYDRLVEDMNMHLAKGRNPFYDVMIVMQADGILIGEESAANQTFIDIEVEPFAIDYTISKLDLTFFFKLEDDFSFDIEYRTDLFHVNTIEKIAADFKTLLLKVMENPDIPVGKLKTALISSEQKQEHCTFENIMSESLTEDF
jgi:acyl carrier protein